MRFIFFTKTEWCEPPRLRHQLADLLRRNGHKVVFFQKSRITSSKEITHIDSSLTLLRHPHLLHHQLKFLSPLRWLDEAFLRRQVRSLVAVQDDDVLVNFNYDFSFLSDLFPGVPLVHIVNDDFPAAAIWPNRASARRLQARTANDASHTFCVSSSILEQIRQATRECSLFLPWARHRYEKPDDTPFRDEVLYWGYINDRIDENVITGVMDHGVKINFVGTITPSKRIDRILGHSNANVYDVRPLEDIAEIRARCSAAIIPYDLGNPYNPAITMSNRGFELLSFGLPLLFTNLPNLIDAPRDVIFRCPTVSDFIAAYVRTCEQFEQIQDEIAGFLEQHYAENRYGQFMNVVSSLEGGSRTQQTKRRIR